MDEGQYAIFQGSGMLLCISPALPELFVQQKGWTQTRSLSVGDKTAFGTVLCVGTYEEIKAYRAKQEAALEAKDAQQ